MSCGHQTYAMQCMCMSAHTRARAHAQMRARTRVGGVHNPKSVARRPRLRDFADNTHMRLASRSSSSSFASIAMRGVTALIMLCPTSNRLQAHSTASVNVRACVPVRARVRACVRVSGPTAGTRGLRPSRAALRSNLLTGRGSSAHAASRSPPESAQSSLHRSRLPVQAHTVSECTATRSERQHRFRVSQLRALRLSLKPNLT